MKLVVFGASGGTGRELVEQARAAGHRVTAVVRSPGDLADTVEADIFDAPSLVPLLAGYDAVLSALGPRGRTGTSVCTTAVAGILQAITEAGVRRIIAISVCSYSGAHDLDQRFRPLTRANITERAGLQLHGVPPVLVDRFSAEPSSASAMTGLMPSAQNTWARHPRATATTIVATASALTGLGMRITMPLQVS
jgi:nucleoside-diphosphate-sugar epimerase